MYSIHVIQCLHAIVDTMSIIIHQSMLSPVQGGTPGICGHLYSIAFPTPRNLTKNLGPRVGTFAFFARRKLCFSLLILKVGIFDLI